MRTKNILIADDSLIFRKYIREMLEMERDMNIVGESGDGLKTIELARSLKPNLVLLDIRMPRMNGLEVCSKLKESFSALKIFIITVLEDNEYRVLAKKNGADKFFIKKTINKKLVPEIRAAFDRNMKNQQT